MATLQETMIIIAAQKLIAAQPPKELRDTLQELLIDWFGNIPPNPTNESRYKAAFIKVKVFLDALEAVNSLTLKNN